MQNFLTLNRVDLFNLNIHPPYWARSIVRNTVVDISASITNLRRFSGWICDRDDLVLRVTKKDGKQCIEAVQRDDLGWFSFWNTDLNKVCQVATPSLSGVRFWDLKTQCAIARLQKKVLHHALRHGTSSHAAAFLKASDEILRPTLLRRIVSYVLSSIWPFSGPHLLSPQNTFSSSAKVAMRYHAPQISLAQRGSVALKKLSSVVSFKRQIYPQKMAMMEKILKGKTDSGELQYAQFQAPSEDYLFGTASDVGRTPMVLKSYQQAFDYSSVHRHFTCQVNFADHGLFKFWKSRFFAQDEVQVLEHPDLGRLQYYLSGWRALAPRTESLMGRPTPWLVQGVKRHGAVKGLYGSKQLAALTPNQAASYVKRLSPKHSSNILAFAAIAQGVGNKGKPYDSHGILQHFLAAYTAFKGAKQEAQRQGKPLAIQTGNWGAGAFGNNAELMAVIQILAARFAGVDHLSYYTYDRAGQAAFDRAKSFVNRLDSLRDQGVTPTLGSLLRVVYEGNFTIGQSTP